MDKSSTGFVSNRKVILVVICFLSLAGFLNNFYSIENPSAYSNVKPYLSLVWFIFYMFFIAAVTYSILKLRIPIEKWGFVLDKKGIISILVGIPVLVYAYFRAGLHLPDSWMNLVPMIIGASCEELIFRALLINVLLGMLGNKRFKGFWAILISSIIFTIPHYHRLYMIQGIFVSSLILGFIFYKTRSIFLPALIHVLSNTASDGGILGGLIVSCFYLIVVLLAKMAALFKTEEARFPQG